MGLVKPPFPAHTCIMSKTYSKILGNGLSDVQLSQFPGEHAHPWISLDSCASGAPKIFEPLLTKSGICPWIESLNCIIRSNLYLNWKLPTFHSCHLFLFPDPLQRFSTSEQYVHYSDQPGCRTVSSGATGALSCFPEHKLQCFTSKGFQMQRWQNLTWLPQLEFQNMLSNRPASWHMLMHLEGFLLLCQGVTKNKFSACPWGKLQLGSTCPEFILTCPDFFLLCAVSPLLWSKKGNQLLISSKYP